jgi:hypothetical protein
MNQKAAFLAALACISVAVSAQTASQMQSDESMPEYQSRTPSASEAPVPAQPEAQPADPSSGGVRPQTESGSGDQSPLQLEAQPGSRITTSPSSLPPPPPMTQLTPKTENGITYLCGGVGSDEASEMKTMARDHDLMLTFAARDGSYLADVNVNIADARGNSVLKTSCGGPIMLVDLGAGGTYKVSAETGGSTVTKTVRIPAKGHGKALVLVWPKSVTGAEESRRMSNDTD